MNAAERPRPWWQGAVIYQIYPASFLDTNGDGWGDLPGITDRLDYIAGLGVDAIWLSPFFLSPMTDFGYDVADFRSVDPRFGIDADADHLIQQAHARGLKVMIDLVLCHTSDQHAWFQESRASTDNPKADWYIWRDARSDGTPPNNWQSVFGGPSWEWDARRGQYYLHHFFKSQPALNWHHPEVEAAVHAETAFWLDKGIDGLRLDAIARLAADPELRDNPPRPPGEHDHWVGAMVSPYHLQHHEFDRNRPEIFPLLDRLRSFIDRYPDRFLLGELADSHAVAADQYMAPGRLHSCYTFQFTWPNFDAESIRSIIAHNGEKLGDRYLTYSFGNHDCMRAISRWGDLPHLSGDRAALAKLVLALFFSLRGSVCLYQGDELGLTETDVPFERLLDPFGIAFWPDYKGRDGCRTPMPWIADARHGGFSRVEPWLPLGADHAGMAVDLQDRDPGSTLNACRRFLKWRKARQPLIDGDLSLVDAPAPVLAFTRSSGEQSVLCIFNLSNRDAAWQSPIAGDPIGGHGMAGRWQGADVHLPPFGAAFAAVPAGSHSRRTP